MNEITTQHASEITPTKVEQVVSCLTTCHQVQKTFGAGGDKLKDRAKAFLIILKDVEFERVVKALEYWIGHEQEFPTPADIRRICEGKPYIYCSKIYGDLIRKRKDLYLSHKEENYIKHYEQRVFGEYN